MVKKTSKHFDQRGSHNDKSAFIVVALASSLTKQLGFEAWIKGFGWVSTFADMQ